MFFSIRSHRLPRAHVCVNHFLYFFQIVKELHSYQQKPIPKPPGLNIDSHFFISRYWWRLTGSNRRPPACKAGALPAELNPRNPVLSSECSVLSKPFASALSTPYSVLSTDVLVGLVGLEPTTPALSTRCSNQLSYRPRTSGPGTELTGLSVGRLRHRFNSALSTQHSVLLLKNNR